MKSKNRCTLLFSMNFQKESHRRKIRLMESIAKCRHLKSDIERDYAAGVYLSEEGPGQI